MTAAYRRSAGFTLVEVLVALALLAAISLGLTTTLVDAQHGRAMSEQALRAIELAAEGVERLRAGSSLDADPAPSGFERTAQVAPWNGHPGLYRLQVTVQWNDGHPRSFQLVTLARR